MTNKVQIALTILVLLQLCIRLGLSKGCGPGKFIINDGLKNVGEGGLIECCDG